MKKDPSSGSSSMSGALIVALIAVGMIPVSGLMTAIAIPNFIKARSRANERRAQATITGIAEFHGDQPGWFQAGEVSLR